ncbi:MAG: NF038122 family metalloprotease [Rivularia sp. ALOHA_DT_140]|nr:NF038122 family metalloprotease [Rivularia sp. ALOHA_DT_140]
MKNNQSSGRINKLFSQGRFILKNLLYISTFLVTTNLPARADFDFDIQNYSNSYSTELEIDLSINVDVNSEFNFSSGTDLNTGGFNLQYISPPSSSSSSSNSSSYSKFDIYSSGLSTNYNSYDSSLNKFSDSLFDLSQYNINLPDLSSTNSSSPDSSFKDFSDSLFDLPQYDINLPDSSINLFEDNSTPIISPISPLDATNPTETVTDDDNLFTSPKPTNLDETKLKFDFTYDSKVTDDQILGFEMASKFWSNYIMDDVTLKIHIKSADDLPENVIGGALPGMKSFDYSQVRTHLKQDMNKLGNTEDPHHLSSLFSGDFDAVNSLNIGSTGEDYHVMVNGEEITGVNQVNMTRANAKALGLISGEDTNLDGLIVISSLNNLTGNTSWNYNLNQRDVPENQLDFLSMAVHELGHIMGFVSSGDKADFKDTINQSKINNQKVEAEAINQSITMLDLFRYSDVSQEFTHSVDGQKGIADLSIGGNPFLSKDRGVSKIADLSSGEDSSLGGDGYQASHWKQNDDVLGIMDPLLGLGKKRKTTYNDRMAMDIIGWDLNVFGNSNAFDLFDDMSQTPQVFDIDINLFLNEIFSHAQTSYNEKIAFARVAPDSNDIFENLNRMLQQSDDFYKWGWNSYSQKFAASDMSGLWQNMSWQKVDLDTPSSIQVKSTPEPTSFIGLLGLSIFGIFSGSQKRLNRKNDDE